MPKLPNKNVTITPIKSREQWHMDRAKTIGCSDLATLFAINPFSNIVELFYNKVKLTAPMPQNINTYSGGEWVEDIIHDHYYQFYNPENPTDEAMLRNAENGNVLRSAKRFKKRITMNDIPLSYTPDFIDWKEKAVVETKATLSFALAKYKDGFNPAYQLQVQGELMCSGFNKGFLSVWVDGRFYREWMIEANAELQEAIKERVLDFWNNRVVPARKVWNDPTLKEDEKMLLIYDNFEPEIDPNAQDALTQFMNTRFVESAKKGKLMVSPEVQTFLDGYKQYRDKENAAVADKDRFANEIRSVLIATGTDEITSSDGRVICSFRISEKTGKPVLRVA